MTDARKSSLHRSFKPDTGIFEVTGDGDTFGDDKLTSITITRGNADPHPSFTPSTIEVGIKGAISLTRDTDLTCTLVPEMASRIAGRTPYTGSAIMHRFKGRKAIAEVDDRRWDRNLNNGKWKTTVTGSSWTSLLPRAERTNSPSGRTVSAVVTALKHPGLEDKYEVSFTYLYDFDTLANQDPQLNAADVLDKYADRLHTLIEHQRDGNVRVVSNVRRRNDISAAGPVWTLPRAHTLAPAKWSSPAESATTQFSVRYTTSGGVPYTQEWPISDVLVVVPLRGELIDIENVVSSDPHTSRNILMDAINNYANWSRAGVESVTIDLGALWRTGTESANRTIVEVLRLEEGAPIHLGADWPQAVRGPYFANQITEKITPDSWRITLDLFHARYVVGFDDGDLPTPQPIIWDAADTIWNATPGKWN